MPEAGGRRRSSPSTRRPARTRAPFGWAAPHRWSTPRGNIWVTTGNGSVTSASHPYDDSDAVLELSPSLTLEQYFAPSNWPSNNAQDLDMSIAPALLADGQVVAAGKVAHRLPARRRAPGGDRRRAVQPRLRRAARTSTAEWPSSGTTVFLPCVSGTIAVTATTVTARTPPAAGSPRSGVARPSWPPDWYGRSGRTASSTASTRPPVRSRRRPTVGTPANHFPTPSVGAGLFLVPTADHVVAFAAPGTGATTTTAPTTTTTRPHHGSAAAPHQSGGSSVGWIVLGAVLVALAVVAVLWLRRRRRRGRRSLDRSGSDQSEPDGTVMSATEEVLAARPRCRCRSPAPCRAIRPGRIRLSPCRPRSRRSKSACWCPHYKSPPAPARSGCRS